jgi:integrase/recombinase XerD
MTTGSGPIIRSERDGGMTPVSIVNWFAIAYQAVGLEGCSSHSGRRTFITRAARLVRKTGGSLRDVQFARRSPVDLQTTQRYIDGDSDAQRKLVSMI